MGEFEVIALGELGADRPAAFATGPFGSAVSAKNFVRAGVPMLRGSNLSEDIGVRLDESDLVFVPEELARQYSRSIVGLGDLIFTCWGTVGQLGILDGSSRFDRYLVSNKQMKVTVDDHRVIPLYLYYYLSQRSMIELVRGQAIGSSVPGFNLGQLKSIPIRLPALKVQRAIVDVLGALDDKIAANERIRLTADDLLAAVFDRLRAGSRHTELRAISTVNRVVTNPVPGGELRYVDISSVGQSLFVFPEPMSWDDAPGRARRVLSAGDTIWSTVRPNRRSHALVLDDDPLLVASTGLAVLTPNPGRVAGLFQATKTDEFVSYLESVAEGSAYPAVRADRFERAPVPDLSEDQWNSFERLALPLRRRSHVAERESRRLTRMRDELLPLLMSGKVRVKDAEAAVSEVL
ncbi:restriction endonuclease subunit S [Candidatus Mycobacterium methanotrophicum]|uniref:Restriction endonuclease subunit S n=1 Tax=Candidatus Mycobacterium methanotrophicum TaxID=2943498 RepID=A0ABY4QI69_9MYCO|nr:restriction endonuclease subunit S [Candidatus Mycobacterium methanotrophicum]UQX10187.1 restriction endonuclease subunit S [Candidatus Mycobacterium methanotrophicum]